MQISVIICTHNPRQSYLEMVLDALRLQTLSHDQWELLLIDNKSSTSLADRFDIQWHPRARHIREERLGLTSARVRGIFESTSDIIVFVDDDNILDPDYLLHALRISAEWPVLGAWGGRISPAFETAPPVWTKPLWPYLAIRDFNHDVWSNVPHSLDTTPCGAGMVVRKSVARAYAQLASSDPNRLGLDRRGADLTSAGDLDLAFTALDLDLGTGQFTCLHLTHLMPSSRLSEFYLLEMVEKATFSVILLRSFRGLRPFDCRPSLPGRLVEWIRLKRLDARDRSFELARRRGREAAQKQLEINAITSFERNTAPIRARRLPCKP